MAKNRILVIGYGNPGRGDDGAGPALAARLENLRLPGLTVESDYQLGIEHAALAAEHDIVVFADAAADTKTAFYFHPVESAQTATYTTHAVTPAEVLALARSCFNASPEAYILGIRAHAMDEFKEGLSTPTREGLEEALRFLVDFIGKIHR